RAALAVALCHQPSDSVLARYVTGDGEHALAAYRQLPACRPEGPLVPAADGNARSRRHELAGDDQTEPAGTSGDEHVPAGQLPPPTAGAHGARGEEPGTGGKRPWPLPRVGANTHFRLSSLLSFHLGRRPFSLCSEVVI